MTAKKFEVYGDALHLIGKILKCSSFFQRAPRICHFCAEITYEFISNSFLNEDRNIEIFFSLSALLYWTNLSSSIYIICRKPLFPEVKQHQWIVFSNLLPFA